MLLFFPASETIPLSHGTDVPESGAPDVPSGAAAEVADLRFRPGNRVIHSAQMAIPALRGRRKIKRGGGSFMSRHAGDKTKIWTGRLIRLIVLLAVLTGMKTYLGRKQERADG